MRPDFIDRYSRLSSPVHRTPAGVKLPLALVVLIATVSLPLRLWPYFACLGAALILLAILSRVPLRFMARRLAVMELFVLTIGCLLLLQPGGGWLFAGLALRSTLCLMTMILLSATTPFSDLLHVLRRAHVPSLLVTTLALMYRYLFVLTDQMRRMKTARAARTFTPGRRSAWFAGAGLIGQLFVRATERSERIYAAMCARGWK